MAVLSYSLFFPLLLGCLLFSAVSTSSPVQSAPAVAPIVNTLADEDDGCGVGACSLRDAIADATAGDTITFNVAGTIVLSSDLGDLDIGKDLTIDGGGAIVVSGGNAVRVFNVTAGNVTFGGLTIADGNVQTEDCQIQSWECGGGILLQDNGVALTVTNSTLSGNSACYGGGGIFNSDGKLTVMNSNLSGNSAAKGGAIGTDRGSVTVTNSTLSTNWGGDGGGLSIFDFGTVAVNDSTISLNTAGTGGGIYLEGRGSITVSGSTLSGNSAESGGGILNNDGKVVLTNSTLSGNSANDNNGGGGGISNSEGRVTVNNSTLSGNSSSFLGGGIRNKGTLEVNNSTLSGNSAEYGGGIFNYYYSDVTVNNSTLFDNRAELSGGGIASFDYLDYPVDVASSIISGNVISGTTTADDLALYDGPAIGSVNVTNSIVLDNVSSGTMMGEHLDFSERATDSFISGGYNLIGAIGPGITFASTGDQVGINDPQLGSLADNGGDTYTHALLPGSLAIDNGECSSGPAADQRSITRPQDGDCDTGAYESRGFNLTLTGGSPQTTAVDTAFANPLALIVSSAFYEPVHGGQVVFSAPASGAGLTFTETTASVGSGGAISLPVTANGTAGSYEVCANAGGNIGDSLTYVLTNLLDGYLLTVSLAGSGSGTVTGPDINCFDGVAADCTHFYTEGIEVTLVAAADSGSTFTGWNGGGCSGSGSCVVTMNSAQNIIASFNREYFPIYLPMIIK